MRYLAVNADDFGFTEDCNDGIVHCHRQGILTATTVMANGLAFAHAVRLAAELPNLSVGMHAVLVQGESIARPGTPLPATLWQCARAMEFGGFPVRDELRAQLEKLLAAGLRPTHIDSHKHTHLLPKVGPVLLELAKEYGIAFVRMPADFPYAYGRGWTKAVWTRWARRRVATLRKTMPAGVRATDHFTGFAWTGSYTAQDLLALIPHLPNGSTELMVHPGFCRQPLLQAPTRLKQSREAELRALCDPRLPEALARAQVQLCNLTQLARQ